MAASLNFPQNPSLPPYGDVLTEGTFLNLGQQSVKYLRGFGNFSLMDWAKTAVKVAFIGITLSSISGWGTHTVIGITGALALCMTYYQTRLLSKRNTILPQTEKPPTPPGEFVSNKILITENVRETAIWQEKLIRSAKYSIELSGCYCGGEIFTRFLGVFEEVLLANPDLQIRIISHKDLITGENRKDLKRLQGAFRDRFFVLETSRHYQFFPNFRALDNHTKMLLVDEKYLVTGGSGIFDALSKTKEELDTVLEQSLFDRLMGKGARDMDAVVSGPLAQTVRQEFYHLLSKWNLLMGKPLSGRALEPFHFVKEDLLQSRAEIEELDNDSLRVVSDVEMAFVCGSPEQGEDNGCAKVLNKYVASAEKSIYLGNMILNEPEFMAHLAAKGREDVEVNVISNGYIKDCTLSKRVIASRNRMNYPLLAESGVNIFEYTVPAHLYHKKVAVFDKKVTVLGSFNISAKSKDCDDECLLVVKSEKIAQQTIDILKEDIRFSHKVTVEEINGYGTASKLVGGVLNMIFDHRSN